MIPSRGLRFLRNGLAVAFLLLVTTLALRPTPVAAITYSYIPAGPTQIMISGGSACALTPTGAVVCGLDSTVAQTGPYIQISGSPNHTCALTPTGAVDCWGDNTYGQAADQPGPFAPVSAAGGYSCGPTAAGVCSC